MKQSLSLKAFGYVCLVSLWNVNSFKGKEERKKELTFSEWIHIFILKDLKLVLTYFIDTIQNGSLRFGIQN